MTKLTLEEVNFNYNLFDKKFNFIVGQVPFGNKISLEFKDNYITSVDLKEIDNFYFSTLCSAISLSWGLGVAKGIRQG